MMRPTRKLLILAAVLLGLGLFAAPQAQAGWWHGHGGYSYGYYGWGYSSYYSPCWAPVCAPVCSVSVCDPCCGDWYVGVRPGPIRRRVRPLSLVQKLRLLLRLLRRSLLLL
jgi:hypothetical protein